MGWRCVVVDTPCKLSVGNNYLIVRNDEVRKIHLSEIYCLMLACPAVNITGIALCELTRNKIKVIFCDEKRDPYGEITGYYGSHNCAEAAAQTNRAECGCDSFCGNGNNRSKDTQPSGDAAKIFF